MICACNPYSIKRKENDVGLKAMTDRSLLSHQVSPIPLSLLRYITNFGQLSETIEGDMVRDMIKS